MDEDNKKLEFIYESIKYDSGKTIVKRSSTPLTVVEDGKEVSFDTYKSEIESLQEKEVQTKEDLVKIDEYKRGD